MASLLSNAPPSTAPCFKCNTCFAAFPAMDMLREHYKSPWHVFNSKRRAHNLPHVNRDHFLTLQKSALKSTPLPAPAMPMHAAVTQKIPTRPVSNTAVETKPAQEVVSSEVAAAVTTEDAEGDEDTVYEDVDDEGKPVGDDEEEEEDGEEEEDVDLSPELSLFDNKRFDTTDECLQYMYTTYGFFIPDSEYLEDLHGLMEYLSEKIRIGNICIYCQKRFRNMNAVQRHMVDKAHCKIAYEDGVDMEDVSDFYDFSATYEDRDNVEFDENGNVLDEELEIAPTGELVLPDGRVLGHRSFRRYYKQYFRQTTPNDAVLAAQREELLRLTGKFGAEILRVSHLPSVEGLADGSVNNMAQVISALPDMDVMDRLIKYQKMVRKNNIMEQKGKMREDNLAKRREYKNNVAKVLSSQTTTAKIRDYHGILK